MITMYKQSFNTDNLYYERLPPMEHRFEKDMFRKKIKPRRGKSKATVLLPPLPPGGILNNIGSNIAELSSEIESKNG